MTTFLLLHSPLMHSLTWSLVAAELKTSGHKATTITEGEATSGPYWSRYLNTVLVALVSLGLMIR